MSDDLLDEATRLADGKPQVRDDVRILRALVERVQQAESDLRVARVGEALGEVAVRERDAAKATVDKVRDLADEAPDNLLDELRTLLAILNGEDA